MGKIKLIVVLMLMLLCLPKVIFGEYRHAGNSATVRSVAIKTDNKTAQLQDLNLKHKVISEVLSNYSSPLLPETNAFVEACNKHNIDCYLLPSIAGIESTFGKHTLQGSHNPFGWDGGQMMFGTWAEGFDTVANGLSENYIAQGADTIETIGPIYAASPTWSVRVRFFHNEFMRVEAEKQLYFEKVEVKL